MALSTLASAALVKLTGATNTTMLPKQHKLIKIERVSRSCMLVFRVTRLKMVEQMQGDAMRMLKAYKQYPNVIKRKVGRL